MNLVDRTRILRSEDRNLCSQKDRKMGFCEFNQIRPHFQDAYTCCQFSGVLIAGRPNFFPLALAAAMPSAWHCLMVSRSCSAMVPITSIRTGLT